MIERILVYGLVSSKTFGGIGIYLTEMARYMSDDIVFDYVIEGSSCNLQSRVEARGGKIYYISKRIQTPLANIQDNMRILRQHRATHDTVYFNLPTLGWIVPIEIALSLDYRVIVHSHGSSLLVNDLKHRIVHRISKWRLSHLNVTRLTCSTYAANFMFYPHDDVTFIHNAVDIDRFRFDAGARRTIRERLHISEDMKVIGFVGRLNRQKNVLSLPAIMKAVMSRYDGNTRMLIIGEGDLKAQLADEIETLNLRDQCLILGDYEDVNLYYNVMDVFVLPSINEGLPIVSIEAQTSGLNCVISDRITREADITGNVTFLSLDGGYEAWGEAICRYFMYETHDRARWAEKIRRTDFDIAIEAPRLEAMLRSKPAHDDTLTKGCL